MKQRGGAFGPLGRLLVDITGKEEAATDRAKARETTVCDEEPAEPGPEPEPAPAAECEVVRSFPLSCWP